MKSITRDVDQYKSELQTSLSKAKDSVQDVNAALAEAREEIGKVTIASQARRFDDEANNHRATAGSWVVASVVVAVATAAFALFSHRVFAAVGIVPASDHDCRFFLRRQSSSLQCCTCFIFVAAPMWRLNTMKRSIDIVQMPSAPIAYSLKAFPINITEI